MIEDIIGQIKQSEKKAKEIVLEARKEYSDIIEKAYEKSEQISSSARSESAKILSDAEKKSKEDAVAEIEKLISEKEIRHKNIYDSAKLRQKDAIDIVIKKVLK